MGIIGSFGVPIAILAIVIAFISVIVFVSRNYLRCPPNEVLVLFGRKHQSTSHDGQAVTRGYRLITGGAAFRLPLLEQAERLSLAVFQITVDVKNAPNKDGVPVTVSSIANVRLASDQALLGAAVEQFLGKSQTEIQTIIHRTLEGIVRQLVGTLSIEDMVRDRQVISSKVIDLTGSELAKLGVKCENFVFTEVTDSKGYIEALGRTRAAEVKRDAEIGEANAQREAMVKASEARRLGENARLDNEAQIADATRVLEVKKAKYNAEVMAEQAIAALAGQIATADRAKELKLKLVAVEQAEVEARTGVAERQAALAEKELVTTQIRPAEAARDAAAITAEGEKQAVIIRAEAARQAAIIQAEAAATAAKSGTEAAQQEAAAIKAMADAEKVRLTAHGEGQAAAEATRAKLIGTAEADAIRARGEAEGTAIRARGEAEGVAIKARLLAEAEGVDAKNKALEKMSDGSRLILVMDRLPQILEQGGEALAKALTPAFQAVGSGLAAVDSIQIVDLGGGGMSGGGAVERFAMAVPSTVLRLITEGRALGVDMEGLLAKIGLRMAKVKPELAHGADDGGAGTPSAGA